MRTPDQARWNLLPGDVASNGKFERTVVDRGKQSVTYRRPISGRLATCTLGAWVGWVKEVIYVKQ